jgi:hypothetical protein
MEIPCAFKDMFPKFPNMPKRKSTIERRKVVGTSEMANKDKT